MCLWQSVGYAVGSLGGRSRGSRGGEWAGSGKGAVSVGAGALEAAGELLAEHARAGEGADREVGGEVEGGPPASAGGAGGEAAAAQMTMQPCHNIVIAPGMADVPKWT